MRTCSVCSSQLGDVDYAGLRIMQCDYCLGHLVPMSRLERLKRSLQDLAEPEIDDLPLGAGGPLKCPCCHLPMVKRLAFHGSEAELSVCDRCEVIWFDRGELLALRKEFQASPQFAEVQEYQRRMQELEASPERMAQLEKNIAQMPEEEDPFTAGITEAFDSTVGRCRSFGLISDILDFFLR